MLYHVCSLTNPNNEIYITRSTNPVRYFKSLFNSARYTDYTISNTIIKYPRFSQWVFRVLYTGDCLGSLVKRQQILNELVSTNRKVLNDLDSRNIPLTYNRLLD